VYTTWCGPCKILEKQVFPKSEAGAKYNKLFVNYRIDAEKGEGIGFAKTYEVSGYPTHLFIDPASKKIIYREVGASAEVADFNRHADIALQEQADPMTLDKYAARFHTGERSPAFLRSYIQKTTRLSHPNDAVLDRYVEVISTVPAVDSNIEFLLESVQTANTKAVPYLFANAGDIATRKNLTGPSDRFSSWSYGSFEQAVKEKNPVLLDSLRARTTRYTGEDDLDKDFWYRTRYYTLIGDENGAAKAGMAEADHLSSRPESYYLAEDAKQANNNIASIRWQLKASNVDSSKIEDLVKLNIEKQPAMLRSKSAATANTLNTIAWDVYEKHAKDPAMISRALGWSKRSLDLAPVADIWAMYADTYAHLLYVSGKKDEAIKVEEEAVSKAAASDAASLKESLTQMKSGKL
jgi:hypothetical protein